MDDRDTPRIAAIWSRTLLRDQVAALCLAKEQYYAPVNGQKPVILTHWDDLTIDRKEYYVKEFLPFLFDEDCNRTR
jgi:hypothetical protein